ncbi:MAG: energy transducer TonB [Cyclobacteriaceae bacterium]|nr:energy transducer TonB [Cyclobacteriaceae bacterium]
MGLFHEPKKTNRADLERIRPVLFNTSLIITLLLVIAAFEWRTIDQVEQKSVARQTSDFEDILDVPQTEIPPPPPPVLQQPRIVEVPNQEEIIEEIKVEFDIDVTSSTVVQELTIDTSPVVQIEEEETDKIFLVVEQSAAPKGGMKAFYEYVSQNIQYPSQARRMNVEGKVFVEFVVDRDGTLTNFVVVKGIGAGCDEEAIRIIQSAPPWQPARQRGKPVRQRMVLPIHFKLAQRS